MSLKSKSCLWSWFCFASLSLLFSSCFNDGQKKQADVSLIYSPDGKVDVVLPASFSGGGSGLVGNNYEAAFVAEVEQSVLQTIELFHGFAAKTTAIDPAQSVSINRIDLYKQRSVSLVSGTSSSAGGAAGGPVEVTIAGSKLSGSLLYDVDFSEWSAVVRGTVGGNQPFMISLGKPYLRRYDKVQFVYSGNVDVNLLKVLPDAIAALVTKAFGDIFTIRGGYVSESQYQDYVALALMRNVDQTGEVSEFVSEFAHKLAEKCEEWRVDLPDMKIGSCTYDPIQVTPVEQAFSMKVRNLGKIADASTMMRVSRCRAIDDWTYLLYVPYFVNATNGSTQYMYRLTKPEVWEPIFESFLSYPNMRADYLASDDSAACGNSAGDCTVFKHTASYASAKQMAATCAIINSCPTGSSQFALSAQQQKSVIELGAQKNDCAVMTAGDASSGGWR